MSDGEIRTAATDDSPRFGSRRALRVLWAPAALALAACATAQGGGDRPASVECVAPDGALAAGATLESAAGTYRLTLVAPAGEGAARTGAGVLGLQPNEPALRQLTDAGGAARTGVSVPLYGCWATPRLPAAGRVRRGTPRRTVDLRDDIWRGPVRVEDFVVLADE